MRTHLKKLRELARLKRIRHRDKIQRQPMAIWDEIEHFNQEMLDIKDCYERLMSGAVATTNSVYEFSESLVEIGDIFLEKTALNNYDDEESDQAMLKIGKVQLQIQKIFDVYRSHLHKTLIVPSESLLNELRTVEAMKSECEEKRLAYETLRKRKEKGKLRSTKSDCFPIQHLQAASDDYDQEMNALLFRMRSLHQGQCRSLLTQGVRHHVAQLSLFRKIANSVEAVAPCIKDIAEAHHIDYDIGGLDVDSVDEDDLIEYGEGNDGDADGRSPVYRELSFDYKQDQDIEQVSPVHTPLASLKEVKAPRKSAPLLADRKSDPNYRQIERSSSSKYESYALPTPSEARSPLSARTKAGVPDMRDASLLSPNAYQSSPLANNKYEMVVPSDVLSLLSDTKSLLQSSPLPPPLLNGFSPPKADPSFASKTKKAKRHSVSGSVADKQWQNKPVVTGSGQIGSALYPHLSASVLRSPRGRPLSTPKLPSYNSFSLVSSPRISELHELPRPPPPLAFKSQLPKVAGAELYTANSVVSPAAVHMHPMPTPLSRSFSIPTRGQVTEHMVSDVPSRPLTPTS